MLAGLASLTRSRYHATMPNDPDDESPQPSTNDRPPWPKLPWIDRLAVVGALAIAAVTTVPRLPPSICYNDFGDLQLASETFGIMHPTGYCGYVTLGYLITRIPGVDPAYLVSLACLFSGIVALWLCILMQVRLGVNAWLASAMSLVLLAHPRVWSNLVAPEVYAPSLAFLVAAAYMLIRYARLGVRRDLLVAALLFGVGLANRPPILFTLPFFLIAWWLARRKWEASWRQWATSLSLAALCAALPVLYTLGFLWFRDRPDVPYNYIEQYNLQWKVLPDAKDGWKAKLERINWHVSGKQFRKYMGSSWPRLRSKLRWLRYELLPHELQPTLAIAFCTVVLGVVITYRRCRPSASLLLGMVIGSVVFVCAYRVHGQSADVLPLLFAATVLGGVAASPLLGQQCGRVREFVAVAFLTAMCVVTVTDAPNRRHTGERADATSYVTELDMRTLPNNAVICTDWRAWPPLQYAQQVLTKRSDIHIINADPRHCLTMSSGMEDRPVFFTRKYRPVQGLALSPYRNLWRLERPGSAGIPTNIPQSP